MRRQKHFYGRAILSVKRPSTASAKMTLTIYHDGSFIIREHWIEIITQPFSFLIGFKRVTLHALKKPLHSYYPHPVLM